LASVFLQLFDLLKSDSQQGRLLTLQTT